MHAATGENAVIVGCRKADIIIGPIGIVIADAMYGEITPSMALAVGQSMIFNTFEGKTMFVMHAPNESPLERAVIRKLNLTDVLDTE